MGRSSTSSAVCSICEHEHRFGDPHIWGDEPKKLAIKKVLDMAAGGVGIANKVVHATPRVVHKPELVVHIPEKVVHAEKVVVHSKHGRYADLEKRRAYRREYMQKKRAEKRGVYEQV